MSEANSTGTHLSTPKPTRRKRIGVDLLVLSQFADTGMVIYTEQILPRLFAAMPQYDWVLFAHRSCPFKLDTQKYSNARMSYSPWMNSGWAWKLAGVIVEPWRMGLDLLFIPVSRAPLYKICPLIIFIHDVGFLTLPEYLKEGTLRKTELAMRQVEKKADLCLTNSMFTRKEFCAYYETPERKVDVTYLGFDDVLYNAKPMPTESSAAVMKRYGIRKPYVLYLGVIQGRKNLVRVIAAKRLWQERRPDLQLVLAGARGWNCDEIYAAAGRTANVILPGRIETQDMPVLYKNAECYILASVYEGFGMPVIEAMACGVPVVLSNRGALPEVGAEAAVYFNPEDEHEMCTAILSVLEDPSRRERMIDFGYRRAAQFTWAHVAEATAHSFQKVISPKAKSGH